MNPALITGARRHFPVFLVLVFNALHPSQPPLQLAWYLRAMAYALHKACITPGTRLVINVPPRHTKSITASVALTAFLLGLDPTTRIMVATYSEKLAKEHGRNCRAIMQSRWYKLLFPNTVLARDGTSSLELRTTAGGARMAVSVGGSVTGFGADVIILDDCMKAEDARSETVRAELKAWYDGTLQTRQNKLGQGTTISIAQRLHEDDLPAYLLERGFDHLCLPAIAEKEEQIEVGDRQWHHRRVGDLLDPDRVPAGALEEERRKLGPQVFSAQYQQQPVAPGGNIVRLEWFGTYEEAPPREQFRSVVQSWDTGTTDEPTSDYSVCLTAGYKDGKWWLLDVLRRRLAFPDLKRAVERQRRVWRADYVVIEKAGTGHPLWAEFRSGREWRPIMWPVTEDKETRLIGVTGQIESGLCLLPADAPWLDEFREELRGFPNKRHDDQVDALSQFLDFQLYRISDLSAERDEHGRKLRIERPTGPRR